jgi:hypothetical protein
MQALFKLSVCHAYLHAPKKGARTLFFFAAATTTSSITPFCRNTHELP